MWSNGFSLGGLWNLKLNKTTIRLWLEKLDNASSQNWFSHVSEKRSSNQMYFDISKSEPSLRRELYNCIFFFFKCLRIPHHGNNHHLHLRILILSILGQLYEYHWNNYPSKKIPKRSWLTHWLLKFNLNKKIRSFNP